MQLQQLRVLGTDIWPSDYREPLLLHYGVVAHALDVHEETFDHFLVLHKQIETVDDLLPAKARVSAFRVRAHPVGVEEGLEHLVATHELFDQALAVGRGQGLQGYGPLRHLSLRGRHCQITWLEWRII